MSWFTQGKEASGPSSAEAEALWDAEVPELDADSAVLRIEDAFAVPGTGPVFTGRVESGTLRTGQYVVVQGTAGTARGTIASLSVGRDVVQQVAVGRYVSVNIPNLSVRLEILGLEAGSLLIG